MDKIKSFTIEDTNKIKGFAIIAMIFHHCFLAPERYAGQTVDFFPLSEHLVNYFALSMKICVAIFTFLSAYGITITYIKKEAVEGEITGKTVSSVIYRRTVKLLSSFIVIFAAAQLYSLIVVHDNRYIEIYGKGIKSVILFLVDMAGLAELFATPTFLATFWYISLALVLIFILPVFFVSYRRFGSVVVLFIALLIGIAFPVGREHTFAYFPVYAFTIVTGMICADRDLIVKITKIKAGAPLVKFLVYIILIGVLICTRQLIAATRLRPVWEGIIPVIICAFFCEFINRWLVIKDILRVMGRHSANIFLIHNFIRIVWYYDFTYGFRNWLLIAAVLLLLSLAVSFVVEAFKKVSGYYKFVSKLLQNR